MDIRSIVKHRTPVADVIRHILMHLLRQGRPAMMPGPTTACAYRSQDGLTCAAGCLIDPDLYLKAVEGNGAMNAFREVYGTEFVDANIGTHMSGAIQFLQRVHDRHATCPAITLVTLREQVDHYNDSHPIDYARVNAVLAEMEELRDIIASARPPIQITFPPLPGPAMDIHVDKHGNLIGQLPEEGPGDTVFADDLLFTQTQMYDFVRTAIIEREKVHG